MSSLWRKLPTELRGWLLGRRDREFINLARSNSHVALDPAHDHARLLRTHDIRAPRISNDKTPVAKKVKADIDLDSSEDEAKAPP